MTPICRHAHDDALHLAHTLIMTVSSTSNRCRRLLNAAAPLLLLLHGDNIIGDITNNVLQGAQMLDLCMAKFSYGLEVESTGSSFKVSLLAVRRL